MYFKIDFIKLQIIIASSIWVLFGCNNNETKQYEIFPIGCLIGIVGSAMLVTSLTAVACFIGENIGTYFYSTLIQPLIEIR